MLSAFLAEFFIHIQTKRILAEPFEVYEVIYNAIDAISCTTVCFTVPWDSLTGNIKRKVPLKALFALAIEVKLQAVIRKIRNAA